MTGIVIYLGNEVLSFGDRIFGIPLSVFWAFRSPWRRAFRRLARSC
jgi:hypothetical protein